MTSRPFFAARRLTACSSASGTLSLKRKTCRPRFSAFSASAAAYGPGTEICASVACSSRSYAHRDRARRDLGALPGGGRCRRRRRAAASIASSAGASASGSPSTRIMRSAGAARDELRDEQAALREDVLVRRRAHQQRHASQARARPDRLRDAHQRDGVLVEVLPGGRGDRHGRLRRSRQRARERRGPGGSLVEWRRIELPTSALRTRRSPS